MSALILPSLWILLLFFMTKYRTTPVQPLLVKNTLAINLFTAFSNAPRKRPKRRLSAEEKSV